ncbi:hypothetical protein UFOVP51_84 [uncultured Caudovirales phage]|uniref:Uncharacterized protein n=1 Tax=uncultured Caudovirales phage TaxID=2100421 RepID=A0A6J5T9F5_9CAUD|nr:hypothetical protein UFOVP51_84 [uncultured Caudovirales phage]CAB4240795.1 hypothetical protein UFOVP34_22 [uncultured Caudovirales phage]
MLTIPIPLSSLNKLYMTNEEYLCKILNVVNCYKKLTVRDQDGLVSGIHAAIALSNGKIKNYKVIVDIDDKIDIFVYFKGWYIYCFYICMYTDYDSDLPYMIYNRLTFFSYIKTIIIKKYFNPFIHKLSKIFG